ncbi:putative embryo sac development arrest EDA7 [Cardiosporidium cionae]|uniref:Embryo sac development arrest EDA7 n=1 Tax=Cardiosporidium cionae TaxID=476202 RepID=A0ABQ7J789_9APIC|nr:putative embryo sac development arrest EDA7 [Cardiosporidium cionae]|eukprot:KAF8819847.1 putative embryo sac development arrest EDA7 [Cardiosporidium cionae]
MLKAIHLSGLRVYSLSAGKTQPEFIKESIQKNTSLRYNEEYRHRIELMQNFEFPVCSLKVAISKNEQFVAAVGIYPPEVRMFDTSQLGLKFSRRLDNEVVDFLFLSEDYKKLVFLEDDRSLEFHAQGGRHHKLRIPKAGRCLCYAPAHAELFIVGSSSFIYRLDLEQGQFLEPLASSNDEINCGFLNPVLPLLATGGSNGSVECWDTRVSTAASSVSLVDASSDTTPEVTAGVFSPDGIYMAAGLSTGVVKVFDIRSHRPLCEKDHRNGEKIKSLSWISVASMASQKANLDPSLNEESSSLSISTAPPLERCLASCDKQSIKLWNDRTGEILASVESSSLLDESKKSSSGYFSPAAIHGFSFYPRSGLCFVPCENTRIGVCFIPSIGLAPRWCSFLDSLTEELENTAAVSYGRDTLSMGETLDSTAKIYDDYQFVTQSQLEQMGVSQLIGTSMLRAYMHGYFMDSQLYRKIKDLTEPFAYEDYKKEKIRQKLESRKKMRIMNKSNTTSVNSKLAEKLTETAMDLDVKGLSKRKLKAAKQAKEILSDERFSRLFTHPDFAMETVSMNE